MGRGSNRFSMDRRHYDPAEAGGVDSSSGKACCGLFCHQGRPLDQLGRRHEGNDEEKAASMHTNHMPLIIIVYMIKKKFK